MSCVYLIAADKELPLCDKKEFREHTSTVNGETFTIGFDCGFSVAPHTYYREAADELGLELKPFQYELDFEPCQTDLDLLLAYLRESRPRRGSGAVVPLGGQRRRAGPPLPGPSV